MNQESLFEDIKIKEPKPRSGKKKGRCSVCKSPKQEIVAYSKETKYCALCWATFSKASDEGRAPTHKEIADNAYENAPVEEGL